MQYLDLKLCVLHNPRFSVFADSGDTGRDKGAYGAVGRDGRRVDLHGGGSGCGPKAPSLKSPWTPSCTGSR